MIRYSLLFIAMIVVGIMATRDWYRGLCFMLPLLAVLERPDMPREMFGIGGINPFNIMLGYVLVVWFAQRRRDGSRWQADPKITRLLLIYMVIISVSTMRLYFDFGSLQESYALGGRPVPTEGSFFTDSIVNTYKWMIPGMLVAVGANSKERVRLAVVGILLTGGLLSLQVIAKMMPALVGSQDLADRALRVLDRDLGYHRVDLAAITASMAWAFLAARPAFNRAIAPVITTGGFLLCTLAMAATGGRAGMLAWGACAFVLGFYRWRKIIVLIPVVAMVGLAVVPGLRDRVLEGFGGGDTSAAQIERRAELGTIDEEGRDRYAITSGRVVVWPMVFEQANQSPIVGFGRDAMRRTGIVTRLREELNVTTFGHPHNAYLQLYLDTGLIGIVFIGLFFWRVLRRTIDVFKEPPNETVFMVAAMSLSFLIVNLTASLGSQSFYPKQGATLFWIVIGLALAQLMRPERAAEKAANHAVGRRLIH